MRSENFVAFFTVSGFFIGLIFSIIKFDDIFDIFFYTGAVTLFFHLFIHFVMTQLIKSNSDFKILFDKNAFEESANEQISILKSKEEQITKLLKSINDKKDF